MRKRISDSEFPLFISMFLRMRGPNISAHSVKAVPRAVVYTNYPLNPKIYTEQRITPPQQKIY